MSTHKPVDATADNLRKFAGEFEQCAVELRAVADAMSQESLETLTVLSNSQQAWDSIGHVHNYVNAVKRAFRDAKLDRGDFGSIEPKRRPRASKKSRK